MLTNFFRVVHFHGQMEAGKVGPGGANTSEGVLANFFNSLLHKKTGQGMAGSPGAQIKTQGVNDDCKYSTERHLSDSVWL